MVHRLLVSHEVREAARRAVVAKAVKTLEDLGYRVHLEALATVKPSEIDRALRRDPGVAKLLMNLREESPK